MNFAFPFLTQSSGMIIGPIAKLLGMVMNGIYDFFLNTFGVTSIGFSIIIFTILVRVLILPLMIKQQKSMKDMQKVQPELKKLQDKYKNKKDPESQKKFQQESSKLYQDHNVNPLGGCLPLLVQMPILFALFAVLRNLPAYVAHVKEAYISVAVNLSGQKSIDFLNKIMETKKAAIKDFNPENQDKIIDLLYVFTNKEWDSLVTQFAEIGDKLTSAIEKINDINYFFTINLTQSPVDLSAGISGIMTVGILIPILCLITQIISLKTTKTTSTGNATQDQTQKTMMYMMPLLTIFFVVSMPAGLGLYWLVGNVFQIFQQLLINKYLYREK